MSNYKKTVVKLTTIFLIILSGLALMPAMQIAGTTALAQEPKIEVVGNGLTINNGDNNPTSADFTNFGSVAVSGGSVVRTFTIKNIGNANLTLSNPTAGGDFSVTQNPVTPVSSSSNTSFQITFDPSTAGSQYATVSIVNNDTDETPYQFWIKGTGVAPDLMVSKSNNVTNSVLLGDTFDWTISVSNSTVFYAVGNTTYNFEDISGSGTSITLSDDQMSPAEPMGFNFDFYSSTYSNVYVCSNGFLTFLAGQSCTYNSNNTGIPSSGTNNPNAVVAGWWEDLNPSLGGSIHYEMKGSGPNRYFIVQFTNIQHLPSGNAATFQFKFFEGSNKIEIHYQTAPSDGGIHSVGIEDQSGYTGVEYFRGTTSLAASTAVNFQLLEATFTDGQSILNDTLPSTGISYGLPTSSNFNNITNSGNISCSINIGNVLGCSASGASVVMGANGSFDVTFPVTPSTGGVKTNSTCQVDPTAVIDESNESNNYCNSDSVLVVVPGIPGVTISVVDSISLTESSTTDSYTVRLDTIPTDPVTITLSPDSQLDVGNGTDTDHELIFDAGNWSSLQTVNVSADNDTTAEGNHSGIIVHSANSADADYDGAVTYTLDLSVTFASSVNLTPTIVDNDVSYAVTADLATVSEGNVGSTPITFTVTRTGAITKATSDVAFALSGEATNGTDYDTVIPAVGSIVFSITEVTKTIKMNVLGDQIGEGDEAITITLSSPTVTSPANGTGSLSVTDTQTMIIDDDIVGFTIISSTAAGKIIVTEPNISAPFTIKLTTEPTAVVNVALITTTNECTFSPSSVALDSGNWNSGVQVTVSAVDDLAADGTMACNITTQAATSSDTHYNGLNPADINVQVNDNDVPGFTIPTNLTVVENSTGSFTVKLNTEPSGGNNVSLPLTSSDVNDCTVSTTTLTILNANWNVNHTVTVTGTNDDIDNVGDQRSCTVTTGNPTSGDGNYDGAGVNPADVLVTVTDDDSKGFDTTISNSTSESGGTAIYQIRLTSKPTNTVTVAVTSTDTTEGTFTPTLTLSFDNGNWNVYQTVVVTGVDDAAVDGNVSYNIRATGSNGGYDGISQDTSLTNIDNDALPNTPPIAPVLPNLTTPEDTPILATIVFTDDAPSSVTVQCASSNDTLVPTNNTPHCTVAGRVDGAGFDFLSGYSNIRNIRITPAKNQSGQADISLTINDGQYVVSTTFVLTVTEVNDVPVATTPISNQLAVENLAFSYTVPITMFSDIEIEGDVITGYSATLTSNEPLTGWLSFNASSRTFSGTPGDGDVAQSEIKLMAIDSRGGVGNTTFNVIVQPVNDAPVAVDDSDTITENLTLNIAVLSNDYDVDVGDTLTIKSTTAAKHGTVNIKGNQLEYIPTHKYVGSDSFDYTIIDTQGLTSTANVNIIVTSFPMPPQAEPDSITTTEDIAVLITPLSNDIDPNGDTLVIVELLQGNQENQETYGQTVISGTQIIYTPTLNFDGIVNLTYVVSDGSLTDSTIIAITVEAVNDAPQAESDTISIIENTVALILPLLNDTDPDDDTLSINIVGDPTLGTIGLCSNMILCNNMIIYTPPVGFIGMDSFTYTVSDGILTDTATVTVTIANDPPVAVDDTASTSKNSAVTINVLSNDTDPDDDTLSINMVGDPITGTVSISGNTVVYTPATGFIGVDSFSYIASDGVLTDTASVTVTVTATNDPPMAVDDTASTSKNNAVTINVLSNDTDPDGSILSISMVGNPITGTASINNDAVVYTPVADFVGVDSFSYIVSDGSLTDTATVAVTVNALIKDCTVNINDTIYASIQSAVNAATAGDTLKIAGRCAGVHVDKSLTLRGGYTTTNWTVSNSTTNPTVLDAQTQDRVVYITNNATVTLENMTMTGSKSSGIYVEDGQLHVQGNTITGNAGAGLTVIAGTVSGLPDNRIFDNTGPSIDLGGDGITLNDLKDSDTGPNSRQNYPILHQAVPTGTVLTVGGLLNSTPNSNFTLNFYANSHCQANGFGQGEISLGSLSITTNNQGDVFFNGSVASTTALPEPSFITAIATNSAGESSEFSSCIIVSEANTAWPVAVTLNLDSNSTATASQYLDMPGQSRWYKLYVPPESKLFVTLTDLPTDYNLAVFRDIKARHASMTRPKNSKDLKKLSAQFAPAGFSPAGFSPAGFSPAGFSPAGFSPAGFSPAGFSPAGFSPAGFSPAGFSPAGFSPAGFSPAGFSPAGFSPAGFSPAGFSPAGFSPTAFSNAQKRTLAGISAFEGTTGEGLIIRSWKKGRNYYIRVRGRNGVYSFDAPYKLTVKVETKPSCNTVAPLNTASTIIPTAGDYKTIILTDLSRMAGSEAEKASLQSKLIELANRSEVAGVIVDMNSDALIVAANAQSDSHWNCPYAKNLVAGYLKTIIDDYKTLNPLEYVVLVGSDDVIPFFRYADNALMGPEQNFVPPFKDENSSQTGLRFNYTLGQGEYGASDQLNETLYLPELAVGRLVENPTDIITVLDAYLNTTDGIIPQPQSAFVSGYDFLDDTAQAVVAELKSGGVVTVNSLIASYDLSPKDPDSWTGKQLQTKFLSQRHDVAFLAGHFSASCALAADWETNMCTDAIINQNAPDLSNAIIYSGGCHSGFNMVDAHGVSKVTREPDWAQAFAQKGAVFVAGTGYQYGDTDFIEYGERLYLEFTKQLFMGDQPVSVGQALVRAKWEYAKKTTNWRGMHEKTFVQTVLYGLPMLRVATPNQTTTRQSSRAAIVSDVSSYATNPGQTLGLQYADVILKPTLTLQELELTNVDNPAETTVATYLSGIDGNFTNSGEPALPLEIHAVDVPNKPDLVLRGVGFRSGDYTDTPHVLPLAGTSATEIRGVHQIFSSDIFYPIQPWRVNYFNALAETGGSTWLMHIPAQYKADAPGATTSTMRQYNNMGLRLFYSGHTTSYEESGNTPSMALPPAIAKVASMTDTGKITFTAQVVGDPSAGIQEVWVTYNVDNGDTGQWQSLDLVQNEADTTIWEAVLTLNNTANVELSYIVQAANGVGLVTFDTNQGHYYLAGVDPVATTNLDLDIDET
ncbi:Ig-like domain-containing protein, partial [Anaerolineales bacterium HSG6]|nr:Ig-like domain-containing protein [Anaerolineales bacterium HSG6]